MLLSVCQECKGSLVRVIRVPLGHGTKRALNVLTGRLANLAYLRDFHLSARDRARLVETQRVHTRQSFYAVTLLDEDVPHAEPRRGDGQHARRQQDEPLRDHAHHRCNRREHRVHKRRSLDHIRSKEESGPERDKHQRRELDDH